MHKRLGTTSRRTFLKAAAATTAALGIGSTASAQQTTSYRLGGEVQGWQGQEPQSINGQTNPTLELQEGTEYEITWENLDGAPHNIAIYDSNGNTLQSTENMSEQGQTQTITFTANSNMAQYICEVHPTSMVGDLNVTSGGGGGGGNQTTTTTGGGTTTTAGGETTTGAEETTAAGETPSDGQPGFGIVAAVGALGSAAAYLFKRNKEE